MLGSADVANREEAMNVAMIIRPGEPHVYEGYAHAVGHELRQVLHEYQVFTEAGSAREFVHRTSRGVFLFITADQYPLQGWYGAYVERVFDLYRMTIGIAAFDDAFRDVAVRRGPIRIAHHSKLFSASLLIDLLS